MDETTPSLVSPARVGAIADFVTAEEREKGKELQTEFDRLRDQLSYFAGDAFRQRYKRARAAYLKESSQENYEKLTKISGERTLFGAGQNKRPKQNAREVLTLFITQSIVPWARTFTARGVEIASESAERVRQSEEERHLALLGRSMLRPNEITEAAMVPVKTLKSLIEKLNNPTPALSLPAFAPDALLRGVDQVTSGSISTSLTNKKISLNGKGIAAA